MSRAASLSPEGEQAWLRLKQHLEWCEHFALGFIFTRHSLVLDVFRERLAAIYRARVTGLQMPILTTPEDLLRVMLPALLLPEVREQALNAPCWLDLTGESSEEWQRARLDFLIRLNEQREKLRNARNRPLILILPEQERTMVREMSPDLWTIRHFTLVTANWLEEKNALPASRPEEPGEVFSLSEYEQSLVAEWERVCGSETHDALKVAERAYKVLLKNGEYEQAAVIAAEMMSISRRIIERVGETPESLRDLSVSLDNVGGTSGRLGDFEAAQKAYQESLSIRRRIIERVGETPESLRDLSVSLYKAGQISTELGKKEEARKNFQEGLHIAEALAKALPDQIDYNELPGYFLKELATLED
ncbi:tetratricopeptide repeat protein [Desulfobulbus sp. US4]|nr:tetratricopeptide repeat protein [Desulfobulbus sp. US4]